MRASLTTGLLITVILAACAGEPGSQSSSGTPERASVVASFYPAAFVAERVGGNAFDVKNLTPPGVEPHDLELDPDAIEAISTADVVLYLGRGFQPAVEQAVANDATGQRVDLLADMDLTEAAADAHAPDDADDADHDDDAEGSSDPHVWLSPRLMLELVARTSGALAAASPGEATEIATRSDALQEELERLDAEFSDGLAECDSRTIVTAHAAFTYLATDYDLEQHPIVGLSPDAEPDPARLAELVEVVQDEGVTTVFTESLVSPRVAQTLAQEAGVGTAVLNPLEGLTAEEADAGEDYFSVMRANLRALQDALGCRG